MNIIFMGTPDFSVPCLEALVENKENVTAVFTAPDKARGRRGNKLMPTPIKETAGKFGIPVFTPDTLKSDEVYETIKNISPELIVVVAYGKILPERILNVPRYGCINIHASLLPKYRGAAPIQRCVLNGEKETGVTSMLMDKGLDTGDMLITKKTDIYENETSAELWDRLSVMGADILIETVEALKVGKLTPVKQDNALATYSPMITKEMGRLDFNKPMEEIHRLICGLSNSPTAFSFTKDGKRLKFFHSEKTDTLSDRKIGSIVINNGLYIVCGDKRLIKINELQLEGSKRMGTSEFLMGNRLSDGDELKSE